MGQFVEEGLQDALEVYTETPSEFYVGLCGDSVIAKDSSFDDLTEVVGSGYGKIALTTAVVTTLGTDNKQATFNEVTFSASGSWTEAVSWFIVKDGVTSGTFILIAHNALDDGAVTLVNSESVSVIPIISASS